MGKTGATLVVESCSFLSPWLEALEETVPVAPSSPYPGAATRAQGRLLPQLAVEMK